MIHQKIFDVNVKNVALKFYEVNHHRCFVIIIAAVAIVAVSDGNGTVVVANSYVGVCFMLNEWMIQSTEYRTMEKKKNTKTMTSLNEIPHSANATSEFKVHIINGILSPWRQWMASRLETRKRILAIIKQNTIGIHYKCRKESHRSQPEWQTQWKQQQQRM